MKVRSPVRGMRPMNHMSEPLANLTNGELLAAMRAAGWTVELINGYPSFGTPLMGNRESFAAVARFRAEMRRRCKSFEGFVELALLAEG